MGFPACDENEFTKFKPSKFATACGEGH